MIWKVVKPTVFLLLFVIITSLSFVGIRKSWVAAAANDQFVCGTITQLYGQVGMGWEVGINGNQTILVPTRAAYMRLSVDKEFTFIYRQGELIVIADGFQCKH